MLFSAPTCAKSAGIKTLCVRETDESTVTRNASDLATENSVLKQAARSAGFGCGSACIVQSFQNCCDPGQAANSRRTESAASWPVAGVLANRSSPQSSACR